MLNNATVDCGHGADYDVDTTECTECNGTAYSIGFLGNLQWFRCRQCGMEVNAKGEDSNGPEE